MKRQPKKLVVTSETVRRLGWAELVQVQGGKQSGEDCTITRPSLKLGCTV